MSQPTTRSVRKTLSRLTEREKATLGRHGFGSVFVLEQVAAQKGGAALVGSVLALNTQTGRRPRRPEDEANVAEAKRRARRILADLGKGKLPEQPPLGLSRVIWTWVGLWAIPLVFMAGGMYVMTLTAAWVTVIVFLGGFMLTVGACMFFGSRQAQAWVSMLPILLIGAGVASATGPLYLRYRGTDVQGEFVRAWVTGKGTKSEHDHCRVSWNDAGTRRETEVDGCPKRFFSMGSPEFGQTVPVHFVLSSGGVRSRVGFKADQKLTWQPYLAGTGLVSLLVLTAWGVTSGVRNRPRDARREADSGVPG